MISKILQKQRLFKTQETKIKKTSGLTTKSNNSNKWSKILSNLQELGKALQFPIAVLPFAALLNRFGALGIAYTTTADGKIINEAGYWISFIIQKPGAVVFDNLALLFAIGLAFGLAKDHRGEVALVGAIFFFTITALTSVAGSLPDMIYGKVLTFTDENGKQYSSLIYVKNYAEDGTTIKGASYVLNIGVLGGIVSGCFSAYLYNKYKEIKLPTALSFFGGRRFVPMIGLVVAIPTAFAFAIIWPWIQYALMLFGTSVANPKNPAVAIPGTAIYAGLNRLLLPFGLHQILNTFFLFQLPINGSIVDPITGTINAGTQWVNGDINAFAKGIQGSGLFQGGFFPIMMGGVPAIAIAMIFAAKPENRKEVSGFLGGVALVSIISGITEPIEFSFVFMSPILLVIHVLLSFIFVAISTAMQIQIGFGFSAGLIDYLASFAQSWGFANEGGNMTVSANPLWTLLLTSVAGGTWFVSFYFLIKWLNIETPGRENIIVDNKETNSKKNINQFTGNKYEIMAENIISAIGENNIVLIDNCATRLRLKLKDNSKINESEIKKSGAFGIKRFGNETLQIVVGSDVEHVANAMKKRTHR
ncbi:PTS sugar transporter subunit IIA [Mesoplasma syrphidae]|uniref:PTS sugar transporter subunit IIA n=1 Tax=Mesoplasma syrphidae TaxID=225999 RepID=A0A2K9C9N8_9MOLU|nr:PTS transporter subunit EIIC [Mesoplasma syrphidae]AUF83735.1 PTS sugar transporter subunit IIA [Mesoplasma syrphidae]